MLLCKAKEKRRDARSNSDLPSDRTEAVVPELLIA